MAVRIQFRRGTAAEWASANPTLAPGELGYETDTAKFKIGDGSTGYNLLEYAGINQQDIEDAISNVVGLAPEDLDTLVELAASLGDDGDFANTVSSNIETAVTDHNAATTNVHGIDDTSLLETQAGAQDKANTAVATAGAYTDSAVAGLVASAPGALDTLNELAAALGDDANFSTTITNSLASKTEFVKDTRTNWVTANAATTANTLYIPVGEEGFLKVGNGDNYVDVPYVGQQYTDNVLLLHDTTTELVHGISNTLDLMYTADGVSLQNNIDDHASSTTTVHGISNTANLAYQSDISTHSAVTESVHGISNTADLAYQSDISTHNSDTTNVHGIEDTAQLETITGSQAKADAAVILAASDSANAIADHSAVVDNVHGIANTADLVVRSELNDYATLASPTFTGSVSLPSTTTIGDVSNVELGYLANVTSDVQEQLNAKLNSTTAASTYAPLNSPTFTGTVVLPVDTSIDGVSAAEIGYLANVTSDVQAQIDTKAPTADPTFTGTVSGVTAAMVGLANVNNTADVNKPISTATQTALDAKLALAGGTMTGKITLDGDPTQALHPVTKQYADSISEGLHIHAAVVALSDSNIDLTGTSPTTVIDGVTLADGDRVIINGQTAPAENGIYVFATAGSVFTRATDFDEPGEASGGDFVFVTGGTDYENTGWVKTSDTVATIGTDPINFTQFSGAGSVTGGTNIEVTGTQVAVVADPTFTDATITNLDVTNATFADGTVQTSAGVTSITGFTEKTASYTLDTLDHQDNVVEMNSASATTFTIPLEATFSWPVGASMDIIQTGAGQVTVAIESGGTLNFTPGNKLRTQWSSCTIMKRATDSWIVYGDLTA
jgi:hypothetical protein